jgi:hypothetical protein
MAVLPTSVDAELPAFEVAGRRELSIHGAPVELVFVPARAKRHGRANAERPALAPSHAARIVADEALWRGDGHVLTPNRFPFAERQLLLWPEHARREPDVRFWRLALDWVEQSGGAALVNGIGAAATIARCHAHLVGHRLPFLDHLSERPLASPLLATANGVALVQKDVPFCLVGVRGGSIEARAEALLQLAEARLTAAANLVAQGDAVWLLPRRIEVPAPHFPWALGAAELWGRWCYMDETSFRAACAEDLERAFLAAGMPPLA